MGDVVLDWVVSYLFCYLNHETHAQVELVQGSFDYTRDDFFNLIIDITLPYLVKRYAWVKFKYVISLSMLYLEMGTGNMGDFIFEGGGIWIDIVGSVW